MLWNFGDTSTIVKVRALVDQGTAALSSFAVRTLDGTNRSTSMSAVIDQTEAKKGCIAVGSETEVNSMVGGCVWDKPNSGCVAWAPEKTRTWATKKGESDHL